MKIYNWEQYSEAWWKGRCGIPTASRAAQIVTPTGKLSAQSDKYMNELLADRAGYGDEAMEPTEWMQRGIDLEPEARAMFEFETDFTVDEVGFITTDDKLAGCSPDGLISFPMKADAEGFEVKCPKASTHIGYLRAGVLPPYYRPQVHWSLAVCDTVDRWHFMSYFPGLDPLIVEVLRDDYTDRVAAAMREFCARLEDEAARFGLELDKAA